MVRYPVDSSVCSSPVRTMLSTHLLRLGRIGYHAPYGVLSVLLRIVTLCHSIPQGYPTPAHHSANNERLKRSPTLSRAKPQSARQSLTTTSYGCYMVVVAPDTHQYQHGNAPAPRRRHTTSQRHQTANLGLVRRLIRFCSGTAPCRRSSKVRTESQPWAPTASTSWHIPGSPLAASHLGHVPPLSSAAFSPSFWLPCFLFPHLAPAAGFRSLRMCISLVRPSLGSAAADGQPEANPSAPAAASSRPLGAAGTLPASNAHILHGRDLYARF